MSERIGERRKIVRHHDDVQVDKPKQKNAVSQMIACGVGIVLTLIFAGFVMYIFESGGSDSTSDKIDIVASNVDTEMQTESTEVVDVDIYKSIKSDYSVGNMELSVPVIYFESSSDVDTLRFDTLYDDITGKGFILVQHYPSFDNIDTSMVNFNDINDASICAFFDAAVQSGELSLISKGIVSSDITHGNFAGQFADLDVSDGMRESVGADWVDKARCYIIRHNGYWYNFLAVGDSMFTSEKNLSEFLSYIK